MVVSPGTNPQIAPIKLNGVPQLEPEGKAIMLAGDLDGVNSMAEPEKISPVEWTIKNAATDFLYTFPAHSLTLLRLGTR